MAITPTPRTSAIAPIAGSITCDATAPDTIVVAFPGIVDTPGPPPTPPANLGNYKVSLLTGPGAPSLGNILNSTIASVNAGGKMHRFSGTKIHQ